MKERIFKWQRGGWATLMERRNRLPHAMLIGGRPGLGKSHLAKVFAQGLLCSAPLETGEPCGSCQACNWFDLGNHPDFRLVQPDSMAPEDDEETKKDKKKSDQIRIEQIRALEKFLGVGTHRGGLRIILIDPADAMNVVTQNALLKSLEEPPPSTLFMLVTSRTQRLLATIKSRCQAVQFATPAATEAQAWLKEQGSVDPAGTLAASAGAPLAAIKAEEWAAPHREFLSRLQEPRFDPVSLAETCAVLQPALVVDWLQRWVSDLLLQQAVGVPRYHPGLRAGLERAAAQANAAGLSKLLRRLGEARVLASHPLNPKLFLEELFLEYRSVVTA